MELTGGQKGKNSGEENKGGETGTGSIVEFLEVNHRKERMETIKESKHTKEPELAGEQLGTAGILLTEMREAELAEDRHLDKWRRLKTGTEYPGCAVDRRVACWRTETDLAWMSRKQEK